MRLLHLQVPSASRGRVMALAREHGARAPVSLAAEQPGGEGGAPEPGWSVILLTLPNQEIGAFVDAVRGEVEAAQVVLLPLGVMALGAPLDETDERVEDVSRIATLELVVASLQSVGGWRGMLVFSVLAGIIAGYGLIFDVSYLLVAAMLVNPMGAPALVAVIGMGVGDARMFGRGAFRFGVSLVVQAAAAAALGLAYALEVSTAMMELVTGLSHWSVLVALAAGAAGAQTQVKSDRDSLVSGTAAGFMVAAALAPPAAVLGLSLPLGRWDYVGMMAFLLALQFLAIAAGGWLVLHAFGVRPGQASAGRGTGRRRTFLVAGVIATTAALVLLQAGLGAPYQRADLSRAALEAVRDAVEGVPGAHLVESSARFTRSDLERHAGEAMLIEVIAERGGAAADDRALEAAVRAAVEARVRERMQGVIPLVRVSVIPGPGVSSPGPGAPSPSSP